MVASTASAHDVAALVIIEQAAAGHPPDKLQLEKLLYLVQGAHLELWGEPAFREPVNAWKRGPVVVVVEQTYRDVVPGMEPITQPVGGNPDKLPPEVADTARLVLRYFGRWSGTALEHYTKRAGTPWQVVRGDLPPTETSNMEIPASEITRWFGQNGLNPSPRMTKADRDLLDRAAAGDKDALSTLTK